MTFIVVLYHSVVADFNVTCIVTHTEVTLKQDHQMWSDEQSSMEGESPSLPSNQAITVTFDSSVLSC